MCVRTKMPDSCGYGIAMNVACGVLMATPNGDDQGDHEA
jgi:hypothetical protein